MYRYGVELLLWAETFTADKMSLIAHAREMGYDGVEIHLRYPDRFPVEETKGALKEYGMGVNFIMIQTPETNTLSPDPVVRRRSQDYLKATIDAAYAVTGGGCVLGGVTYGAAGYTTGRARTAEEWEWAVTNVRAAARHAGDKGIVIAVEALNRFETHFLNTAADSVQFCKDVGEPNVKVHLDTYHMIREEKSFYDAIVQTGNYLGYFHTCENDRGTPGTGLVQWQQVYRGLKAINYQGWIVVESFVPDIEELARITAVWRKLAPSADYLAGEGLKNLRAFEASI
jgi:D-psicose/D-tagatose/L-ribulose 3-epimerase